MARMSVVTCLTLSALLGAGRAVAQPAAATPTMYTYVAEWQIPRAQWAAFAADFEKSSRPALEKLATSGAIVGWGAYEVVVHTEKGATHGVWWIAPSAAGLEQARLELLKSGPPASLNAATSHHDLYLRSIGGNGKPASGTGGYLSVSSFLLKPGKQTEWRQIFDKFFKPALDDLVAKGVILGYSIDQESVHTESPLWRHLPMLLPNIEAQDKIGAAMEAAIAQLSPADRQLSSTSNENIYETSAHRDLFARVLRYWAK
jgi:hypothetical protein